MKLRARSAFQSLAKVIAHLESGQFKWNDIYLAATTPGQSYAGTFAGSDGANFLFRDDETEFSWEMSKT